MRQEECVLLTSQGGGDSHHSPWYQPKRQSEYSLIDNQSKPACAAAHRRLPTLYDTLNTAFDRERIHEGPPTYTGSRATGPLIDKLIPYPNEFAGGHWHSRGAA